MIVVRERVEDALGVQIIETLRAIPARVAEWLARTKSVEHGIAPGFSTPAPDQLSPRLTVRHRGFSPASVLRPFRAETPTTYTRLAGRCLAAVARLPLDLVFVEALVEVQPFEDELDGRGDHRRAAVAVAASATAGFSPPTRASWLTYSIEGCMSETWTFRPFSKPATSCSNSLTSKYSRKTLLIAWRTSFSTTFVLLRRRRRYPARSCPPSRR